MCNECYEKEKKLNTEKRKHRCEFVRCGFRSGYAYFLIGGFYYDFVLGKINRIISDILSQESALAFTPMGYLLVKVEFGFTNHNDSFSFSKFRNVQFVMMNVGLMTCF